MADTVLVPFERCSACGSIGATLENGLCCRCDMSPPWDDAPDDDQTDECEHGFGFDEECEDCDALTDTEDVPDEARLEPTPESRVKT